MKKIKEFLSGKLSKVSLVAAVMSVVCSLAVFADGESGAASSSMETITTAFSTGFQGIVNDGLSMIAIIVPIALGLAGVIFLVRKAMSWFKGMAKG